MTRPSSATSPSAPDRERAIRPATRHAHAGGQLGRAFGHALARQDFPELGALLHPQIALRALTPRRTWAPEGHSQSVALLQTWFGDCEIEQVVRLDTDAFADCQRVAYRFRGRRPDGPFVIEQQAYFGERGGQIDWMRIMCSGFRAP